MIARNLTNPVLSLLALSRNAKSISLRNHDSTEHVCNSLLHGRLRSPQSLRCAGGRICLAATSLVRGEWVMDADFLRAGPLMDVKSYLAWVQTVVAECNGRTTWNRRARDFSVYERWSIAETRNAALIAGLVAGD